MNHRLPDDVADTVARALAEDVGSGDVTASLVPAGSSATAVAKTREDIVLCGSAWFEETFRQLDAGVRVDWRAADGDTVPAGAELCTIEGPTRAILSGERTALNFLQLLSGTATTARRWAGAVAGTRTRVLDTRKTLPGLRTAQKYAVRCGGCDNHRQGLWDGILVKENHVTALGGITAAVEAARRMDPGMAVEVEVETPEQLEEAIASGCDRVLLDNFAPEDVGRAVRMAAGRVELEASGNITLDGLAAYAATGVDYVSSGALTKHARAVDLSLRIVYKS